MKEYTSVSESVNQRIIKCIADKINEIETAHIEEVDLPEIRKQITEFLDQLKDQNDLHGDFIIQKLDWDEQKINIEIHHSPLQEFRTYTLHLSGRSDSTVG